MAQFKKATRESVPLKIALTGPSGSGKTYSALLLAQGLVNGGRIALIDTENGRASLYSDLTDFDVLDIDPPYTVEKYIEGIKAAIDASYTVLIIDSLSHEWAGDGGLLSQKEQADARGGNQFANWGPITKKHERFKAAIVDSPINIIATMRSKQDYVLDDKNKPQKVGFSPVQREGMDYEFMVVFDLDMSHGAKCSKDNTELFDGSIAILTPDHGTRLREWRDSGVPQTAKKDLFGGTPDPENLNDLRKEALKLAGIMQKNNPDALLDIANKHKIAGKSGIDAVKGLTKAALIALRDDLNAGIKSAKEGVA